MKKLAIVAASILAATSFATVAETISGANVHAEFNREVPTVCKLTTSDSTGNAGVKDGAVHAGGKLLFKGEELTREAAAIFNFESNVNGGAGELEFVSGDFTNGGSGNDASADPGLNETQVNFFVNKEQVATSTDNIPSVVTIKGEFVIHAQLNDEASKFAEGSLLQADAHFNATNGQGGDAELDCGAGKWNYYNKQ